MVSMTKGRGSNVRRANRRMAGRRGGGSQSGRRFQRPQAPEPEPERLGWWARFVAWFR